MKPATRSSNQPLGGSSGDWRHRVLRFHVPLALANAGVLLLFMTLPPFDAAKYSGSVDLSSGAFPQQRGEGRSAGHSGGQTGSMGHGGDQTGPMDHGGGQSGATGHDEDQASSLTPSPDQSQSRSFIRRFTVATGYVATGLLALTLLIGPANLLLRRRNPVSSYMRRDLGTWTAIFSVVHVIYGLQVHGSGQISNFINYFVAPDGSLLLNSFGLGNWTGLAATAIVVGLLGISSNFALRKLKAGPWKWLQRLNYALFALVIAHAFFYGALVRTNSPYTLLLLLSIVAVFVGQAVGVWLWQRRHAASGRGSAA